MPEVGLRGLIEVASDILAGVFEDTTFAYTQPEEDFWDNYDTVTPD